MSEEGEIISNVFIVDPKEMNGLYITGQPSNSKYKQNLTIFKIALDDFDYVFAAVIQIFKKGVIENSFPTLGVAFDNSQIKTFDQYLDFISQISNKLSETISNLNLPINLMVFDYRDSIGNNFKKSSSWEVAIKNKELYFILKPWWKIW